MQQQEDARPRVAGDGGKPAGSPPGGRSVQKSSMVRAQTGFGAQEAALAPRENDRNVQAKSLPGRTPEGGAASDPVQRSVDPVSGAIAAGAFALSLAPGAQGGLTYQEVTTSYSRSSAGNRARQSRTYDILRIFAHMGGGRSECTWQLRMDTDGDSILSANTEFSMIDGFDGGMLGSTGSVMWAATSYGGERDQPLKILLTCTGMANPVGAGSAHFNASLLINGNGTVERRSARTTNVTGDAKRTWGIHTFGSGWAVDAVTDEHFEEHHGEGHDTEDYHHGE